MRNWESILVGPGTPLEKAIETLNRGGLRIILVVDGDRRLLGTVTDGDVRRALLGHLPLSTAISEVMWPNPTTVLESATRDAALAAMEASNILQLPVLNADGRVVGLHTIQGLLDRRLLPNPVFLMAGGFGKRLYPLTKDCPKPLLRVGGKPILELILSDLIEVGFHRFFISTHYMPEMIREHFGDGRRWGVTIEYVHEEEPLGTGGALGLLPHDRIDLPMLMMNGDLLTRVDFRGLLDFHVEHGGAATMCVREYEHQVPFGVVESDGMKMRRIIEKPIHKFFVNAGIYMLSPEVVHGVRSGERLDMPHLLERTVAGGAPVLNFPIHEYWLDIGRPEDFDRAQTAVDEG